MEFKRFKGKERVHVGYVESGKTHDRVTEKFYDRY